MVAPRDQCRGLCHEDARRRLAGDVWWEPLPDTMANAWASWSTIGTSYAARVAFGWRPVGLFYLGPEVQALGDGSYRELRFGLHVTSWRTGPLEWSAGGGYAHSQDGDGPYVRVGVLVRE